MKVHELQLVAGTERKRVGRGIGSGYGKTAGRGTKGQKARSGGNLRPGFEGGQNPLSKRLPKKRGFASINPVTYQVVNLTQLERFKAGSTVDGAALADVGLVKHADRRVKLLAEGEIKVALTVKLQAASQAAQAAIAKAGGSFEQATLPKRTPKPAREDV